MPEKSENKNQGPLWLTFSLVWLSLILFSWMITSLTTAHIQYSKFIRLLNQNQVKEVEIGDKELNGSYIDSF